MARRLRYSARYPVPAQQVFDALSSPQMWDEAMVEYRNLTHHSEVVSLTSDPEKGMALKLSQTIPRTLMPPIAQTVMKTDMHVTRNQWLSPVVDGRSEGGYDASIPAGPGSLTGESELTDTETGSVLRLTTTVKVYIPFINSKLEQLILVNLVDLFREEAKFTSAWIEKNF